jgi:hypothetical protein
MDKIINTSMLANPFNWAIIYLIVVFAGMGVRAVSKHSAASPDNAA